MSLSKIKAVVFDFDGVIVNTLRVNFDTYQEIAKVFGIKYPMTYMQKNTRNLKKKSCFSRR